MPPPHLPTHTLRTARLDLLPLRVEHAGEMAEVLSDPALHTFIGGTPATPEALRSRYERLVAGSPDPAVLWCNWVLRLREEGCLVGTVQATLTGEVAEIAWVVGTPWQGRGFAGEAARGLVGRLGEEPGVRTVVAHVHPDHRASAAVAAAAGLGPTDRYQDGEVRWELPLRR
ncbi:GNAT family N-acetyltransferase [Streptomyces sp. RLB1-33]|uniref:GNAT family N-acetyltransferase n=1 Tax=Streptomyces mirabilis TaxID=68239 RepID=UPI00143E3DD8|nr:MULTISPECIES: GNAT family N-acetyltransferase [Streptomyces]QIY71235.1 GNAT family N-acetyltransferase [Streptomyces sp. RLB1-33]QUW81823.1 GNAT family N-acetyltransferase [Streptomyces mirabilis]